MNHTNFFSRCQGGLPKAVAPAPRKPAVKLRRRRPNGRLAALGLALLGVFAPWPVAGQIVIQPTTESASKDAKIYGSVPTGNFSSNLNLTSADTGTHFLSLVQFDLASLGALNASAITSATLTLYATGLGASDGAAIGGEVTLSPIMNGWRENAADSVADPLATYDAFFGSDPTLTFASAVATQSFVGSGFYTWDITATVQGWVDGSLANRGLLIQIESLGGDIGFADADSHPGVLGSAPKLIVVPEPGSTLLLGSAALFLGCFRRRTD